LHYIRRHTYTATPARTRTYTHTYYVGTTDEWQLCLHHKIIPYTRSSYESVRPIDSLTVRRHCVSPPTLVYTFDRVCNLFFTVFYFEKKGHCVVGPALEYRELVLTYHSMGRISRRKVDRINLRRVNYFGAQDTPSYVYYQPSVWCKM